MMPSTSSAVEPGRAGLGAVLVTAATVVIFLTTLGALVLGFVTSAGTLMHLPIPAVATGDAVAAIGLAWLGWRIARAAWAVECRLRRGAPDPTIDGA